MNCQECGSEKTQKYGVRRNHKGFFQRWKCLKCGAVYREEEVLAKNLDRQGESIVVTDDKGLERAVEEAIVDSWVMLVLLSEKSGITEDDFWEEWGHIKTELRERASILEAKLRKSEKNES